MSSVRDDIKTFIGRELLDGQDVGLDDESPLLELGLINSMSVVSLQRFAHERFGVEIPSTELVPENFATVRTLEELIERLRGVSGGTAKT